jgi:hypothetical protein
MTAIRSDRPNIVTQPPYAKIQPRNHFTLKKMGVSDAMEFIIFICKNLTGHYWLLIAERLAECTIILGQFGLVLG